MIGSSPADGSSKNSRSGSSIIARAMPARFFMPPEISPGRCSANAPSPTRSSFACTRSCTSGAADARPGRQREREVLGQRQRAEERARLEEHAERRHALVEVRLADAVDVDAAGHRLLQADQVAEQRALAAARAAENRQGRSALDLEADVLHQHARAPPDPEILDDDVRPGRGHVQMPSSVKNSVKSALITITPKMASTTAVVVRAPTAAAPPRAASPCPQAMSPIASARNGRLDQSRRGSARR